MAEEDLTAWAASVSAAFNPTAAGLTYSFTRIVALVRLPAALATPTPILGVLAKKLPKTGPQWTETQPDHC